jgi:uncharacterized membrane protein
MFFFDPDKGRRRRALVRDKAVHASTQVTDIATKGARDLANRGTAMTGRVRSMFNKRPATDKVLVERVRSKMGRYTAHPGAIDVTAAEGQVTLSGSILAHEHDPLIEGISQVPGVRDILDQLTIYETAEGISELQGGRERRDEKAELQDNWAPGTRLIGGAAGTGLTVYALARSNRFAGFIALATGVALLARAASNKPLRALAGIDKSRGIEIQKTIYIHAPTEEVYAFLADYDNFPQFMRNILSVQTRADGISHWKVAGPGGTPVEWDSTTTRQERNRLIEWSTVEGSTVEHTGSIELNAAGPNGTRVQIRMSYSPPAGVLGHAIAKLLGSDPKTELDEDMMRLKIALETGKPPRDAAAARQEQSKEITT